ncbi:hypothetical protein [Acidiferrobacter sp.]|uniref:hypothetical protein n=1 Tax=Acidiferrobacter sp. TaxID=1872107 RepID=UPI00261B788D|nr:hypothetical protein [Acidiferrobacter sp.]
MRETTIRPMIPGAVSGMLGPSLTDREGLMRIERTDPVTGNTLTQTDGRPYLIEGEGPDALKIYFESEETRRTYQAVGTEHPEQDLGRTLDNPAPLPGDQPNGIPQQRG